jgi:hypothetical protein
MVARRNRSRGTYEAGGHSPFAVAQACAFPRGKLSENDRNAIFLTALFIWYMIRSTMKHSRASLFGRPLIEILVIFFVLSEAIAVAIIYLSLTR